MPPETETDHLAALPWKNGEGPRQAVARVMDNIESLAKGAAPSLILDRCDASVIYHYVEILKKTARNHQEKSWKYDELSK